MRRIVFCLPVLLAVFLLTTSSFAFAAAVDQSNVVKNIDIKNAKAGEFFLQNYDNVLTLDQSNPGGLFDSPRRTDPGPPPPDPPPPTPVI